MIQNIIKKVTKIKPKLSTTGGTSDLRFIRKISPGLEFGLVGKTMHKVDEAVSFKKDLKKSKKNIYKYLQNILNENCDHKIRKSLQNITLGTVILNNLKELVAIKEKLKEEKT